MSIKDIENQIILHSSSLKGQDIVRCQVYLELRKKLLDSQVIDHFDKYVGELASFNERLTVALKTMWADAHDCFDKQKASTDYVIETKAYVELDYDEAVLDDNQIEIYSLLSDSTYNPLYREGTEKVPFFYDQNGKCLRFVTSLSANRLNKAKIDR